jgi:hypothetical protein
MLTGERAVAIEAAQVALRRLRPSLVGNRATDSEGVSKNGFES